MGDTGPDQQCPPRDLRQDPDRRTTPMPRLALFTLVVCLLAVAAAVVSFANGSWLGVVWVLLAGLSSNMTWYYVKREKIRRSVTR
ncbi:hypothetical protein [Streptomyces sp. NPDC059894]|uniref:hypothetical protein n=1 Tax=unclassified Streptomyces TaxID=2593676 RepID=UPI0036622138